MRGCKCREVCSPVSVPRAGHFHPHDHRCSLYLVDAADISALQVMRYIISDDAEDLLEIGNAHSAIVAAFMMPMGCHLFIDSPPQLTTCI